MAVDCPVPAQLEAGRYLEQMAEQPEGPCRDSGHSKGGNVAVYAAANYTDAV